MTPARESERALTGRTLRSSSGLLAGLAALIIPALIANVQRENRALLATAFLAFAGAAILLPSAVIAGTLCGCVVGGLLTPNALLGPGSETGWRLLAWAIGGAGTGCLIEWLRQRLRRSGFRA